MRTSGPNGYSFEDFPILHIISDECVDSECSTDAAKNENYYLRPMLAEYLIRASTLHAQHVNVLSMAII